MRRAEFHIYSDKNIRPSFSSLVDGISRQISSDEETKAASSVAEELLESYLTSASVPNRSHLGISHGSSLPNSFEKSCADPNWLDAIVREYGVLILCQKWTYVHRTPNIHPVPFKWTFRAQQVDETGTNVLYKAQCVLCGDMQEPYQDFYPKKLYAPSPHMKHYVYSLPSSLQKTSFSKVQTLKTPISTKKLDVPKYMEQPTNSRVVLAHKESICKLRMYVYGAKIS